MEDCNLKCVSCDSTTLVKDGKHNNMQRYRCKECGKRFDYGEYKETRFIHFNTYCNGTTKKKLTRENYCKPTSEISDVKKNELKRLLSTQNYTIPNKIYLDENTYTDEYVKKQYEECMNNFDKNIRFFSNLNKKDFENSLNKFVKKNRFKEVFDLNELSRKSGLFILVLDEYKQVYIGRALIDLKEEIKSKWSGSIDFDRLIYGDKENSRLSILSFGALDTTRIFYKLAIKDIDKLEDEYVENFEDIYILNRIAGGKNGIRDNYARKNISVLSTKKRNFD